MNRHSIGQGGRCKCHDIALFVKIGPAGTAESTNAAGLMVRPYYPTGAHMNSPIFRNAVLSR
jgi:hypothetical protein